MEKAIKLYENGEFEEAYQKFYHIAITKKDSEAQLYLGIMYEHGEGVEKSLEKAKYWYKKAYRQKNLDAGFRLQTLEYSTACRC